MVRLVIRKDRLGPFVIVLGKKYRIGKAVSKKALAKWALKALKKRKGHSEEAPELKSAEADIIRSLEDDAENILKQRERERAEESTRNEGSVRQAVLDKEKRLTDILSDYTVKGLTEIAKDIRSIVPGLKRPIDTKPELTQFILTSSPSGYTPQGLNPKFLTAQARVRQAYSYKPVALAKPESPPPDPSAVRSSSHSSPAPPVPPRPKKKFNFKPLIKPAEQSIASTADSLDTTVPLIKPNAVSQPYEGGPEVPSSKEEVGEDRPAAGKGVGEDKGMSNIEIDKILSPYPEFLGTISHDQVKSVILPRVKPGSRGGFVINTDPVRKPGQHWQAVFWDARPQGENEIDFFDSYGDPIDPSLQKDLLSLASALQAGTYLKFKENRVKYQSDSSSNCGWFCVKFLMDRFRGRPFADASGWNETLKGESSIENFKRRLGGRFGYVPSFKEGGIGLPVIRTYYPPSVKKYLTDKPITTINICRKPIAGYVNTLLNIVSFGGWNAALKKVGIDKALHLYMVLNGNTVLERNHVIEMKPGSVQGGSECVNVPLHGPITFKQLLERTSNAVGPALQIYDPRANNCQVFLTQVLRANGLLNPQLSAFVNQNIKGVFEHLPSFVGKLAKEVTDIAHRADTVVHGQRIPAPIREVSPDPGQRKIRLESVHFSKEDWTPFKAGSWLTSHELKTDDFDESKRYLRFRQFIPLEEAQLRTFDRNLPAGVQLLVDYGG